MSAMKHLTEIATLEPALTMRVSDVLYQLLQSGYSI
jgi:hypothetical protein